MPRRNNWTSQITDSTDGHHSIRTNEQPTSPIPHYYARCLSFHNPSNLFWLGTGIKYAGLHTQWHGWYPVTWVL